MTADQTLDQKNHRLAMRHQAVSLGIVDLSVEVKIAEVIARVMIN